MNQAKFSLHQPSMSTWDNYNDDIITCSCCQASPLSNTILTLQISVHREYFTPTGSIGRVAVSSTRLSDIDLTQPVYLAIVNTNTTNVIDEVQVLSCDGVLVSDDSLAFPPQEFRYRLRGTDCNGNSFSFTSQTKVVIDLQLPTTTVLNDHIGLSLRVGETRTLSTRLHHSAVGNTLFFSASASDGLTLENPTDEVTVPAGGNFTVMVTVTVSTSLAPGSTVFLYVLVEDPCSNITVTFHWSIHIRGT